MDKNAAIKKFNDFRGICLKNSEDLLKAAEAVLNIGIDHAAFHLTFLALEEIGKFGTEALRVMSSIHPSSEPLRYKFDIEDHERKIFWALWGHSFGRQKQTKELIDTDKKLATNLHNDRLIFLYADPNRPQHWSELMGKGQAKQLYDLVEARLKLEQTKGGLDESHAAEPDEDLTWFFRIQEDDERRKEIWGHKSQEKLIELGDVKKWVLWLRSIYEKNEEEMRSLVQKELQRERPSQEEMMKNKWRIRIEIVSPSHSIREKNLKEFNDVVNWIKLTRKDAHVLGVELLLSKAIPVHGLWEHGWGMARMFVAALNIATNGLFWWNVKRDPSKYYEEIWDLENDAGVVVSMNPRLEINWREKRFVLRPPYLSLTSLIFSYITSCWIEKKDEHLNRYVAGLSLLAKNDIHLRLEMNAFEEFFLSLKTAMIQSGDWDQKTPFEEAYQKATAWRFPEITDEMRKTFPLGFKVEKEHQGNVDLTAVYAMKNYCEIYLQTLAIRHIKDKEGKDVRIVLGEDEIEDESSATPI